MHIGVGQNSKADGKIYCPKEIEIPGSLNDNAKYQQSRSLKCPGEPHNSPDFFRPERICGKELAQQLGFIFKKLQRSLGTERGDDPSDSETKAPLRARCFDHRGFRPRQWVLLSPGHSPGASSPSTNWIGGPESLTHLIP